MTVVNPAVFPFTADGVYWITRDDEHKFSLSFMGGLSLRDYFAGQALAGRLAKLPEIPISELARLAYEMADAMLATRAK